MISEKRLLEDLVLLMQTSTEVPAGRTEIGPGDERIVSATKDVILPLLLEMGPDEVRQHNDGDIAVRFGPKGDDGLLLMTYVVSQHANLMDREGNGVVAEGTEFGMDGKVVIGQGATQNKGPMASVLEALRNVDDRKSKPLWVALNTEGSSGHGGSRRILEDLQVRVAEAIVMIGTDLRVSIGNRGRTDVVVTINGLSCHSSQPWLGGNPIDLLPVVLEVINGVLLPADDPELGPLTLTPFQITCDPIAPHTIPETVSVHLDRRLGRHEQPGVAVEQIRAAVGSIFSDSLSIEVSTGPQMLPSYVSPSSPIVEALTSAAHATGKGGDLFTSMNAFDAGFPCSLGIPTPMFGPGKRLFAGSGLTGVDAISVGDCAAAAEILTRVVMKRCA